MLTTNPLTGQPQIVPFPGNIGGWNGGLGGGLNGGLGVGLGGLGLNGLNPIRPGLTGTVGGIGRRSRSNTFTVVNTGFLAQPLDDLTKD